MKNGLILSLGVITGLVTAFDGGMILANQMVGDKQYSEAEFQEYGEQQREEGYNEGLTVNVGYSEEDLQNAYEQGIAEMEEILSVVGNKNIIYGGVNIELFTDGNGMIDGVFMHNFETNKYSKIISSGTDFDTRQDTNNTKLVIYGINSSEGCYIVDLTTYEVITIEEKGQRNYQPYWEGNGAFLRAYTSTIGDQPNSAQGIIYIDFDTMEITTVVENGYGWNIFQYQHLDYLNLYRFYSDFPENPGWYIFDTNTKTVETITTEGYAFVGNDEYDLNGLRVTNCALGVVQINDDKTLTVLLPVENGEYWDFSGDCEMVYNSKSIFEFNTETNSYEKVEFGVEPIEIVFIGTYQIYNAENKLVIYSHDNKQVYTIETPDENIRLKQELHFQWNDLVVVDENNTIYKIDLDKATIEEIATPYIDAEINSIASDYFSDYTKFYRFFTIRDGTVYGAVLSLYGIKSGSNGEFEVVKFAENCSDIYYVSEDDTSINFSLQDLDGIYSTINIDFETFESSTVE